MKDPLAGSQWSSPGTVAGFTQSPPNELLIQVAARERHAGSRRLLDIGCGAGRNAVPLATSGWDVFGVDLSLAMLKALEKRIQDAQLGARLHVALAGMQALPVPDGCMDFVIAHGIWNLARSAGEFRAGVAEAARVAKEGSALFVFTFSRNTLPVDAEPVAGEPFAFTQFSGQPQCFLTDYQLVSELHVAGFAPDPAYPLRELNRHPPAALRTKGGPVIYEGVFRRCMAR